MEEIGASHRVHVFKQLLAELDSGVILGHGAGGRRFLVWAGMEQPPKAVQLQLKLWVPPRSEGGSPLRLKPPGSVRGQIREAAASSPSSPASAAVQTLSLFPGGLTLTQGLEPFLGQLLGRLAYSWRWPERWTPHSNRTLPFSLGLIPPASPV